MVQSLHLLLSYACSRECSHCFVWGGPSGPTMNRSQVHKLVDAAAREGMESVAFEGGEPFLQFDLLRYGVQRTGALGLRASVVTNAMWANSLTETIARLEALVGEGPIDLMISTDAFHGGTESARCTSLLLKSARALGIEPAVARTGFDNVMFRGRATHTLAHLVEGRPWCAFDSCPHENLLNPSRVHVDAAGFVHLCQGLAAGRFDDNLGHLCSGDSLKRHPVVGKLARGGPARLVREYGLDLHDLYADACHLCYEARKLLRGRFAGYLGPDRMYGVFK